MDDEKPKESERANCDEKPKERERANETEKPTNRERSFLALLASHDWTFPYCDDYTVYCRGRDENAHITALARSSPVLATILRDWLDYRDGLRERPRAGEYITEEN